ncbi:hypothetical protein [Sphingopyxis sp.]
MAGDFVKGCGTGTASAVLPDVDCCGPALSLAMTFIGRTFKSGFGAAQ